MMMGLPSCNKDLRRFLYSVIMTIFIALILIATYPRGLDSGTTSRKTRTTLPPHGRPTTSALRSSYELARTESYGLLTDVTEDEWKILRSQARAATANRIGGMLEAVGGNTQSTPLAGPVLSCPRLEAIGQDPTALVVACNPQQLYRRANCLIYSIGSSNQHAFEESLYSKYGRSCDVHVFDKNAGPDEKADQENIFRHPWDVRPTTLDDTPRYDESSDVSFSLAQVMEKLGHTGRRVDLLHIACDDCQVDLEWLPESIDVRQLLIQSPAALDARYVDQLMDQELVPFSGPFDSATTAKATNWGFVRLHANFLEPPTPTRIAAR
jgi:Methyltransferase domain